MTKEALPTGEAGSDFKSVSQEALLELLDDLNEDKITKEVFDKGAEAIKKAQAAGSGEEALEVLKDALVDGFIPKDAFQKMEASLAAETPARGRGVADVPVLDWDKILGAFDRERESGASVAQRDARTVGEEKPTSSPGSLSDQELAGLSRQNVEAEQAAETERIERVAREAADALVGTPEDARAVVLGAAPADMSPVEREEIAQEIAGKEGRSKLVAKVADYLKNLKSWEFVAGFGVGGVTRYATKAVLVSAFGSTLGTGVVAGALIGSAAGAVGGALTGGVREYIRERRKFTAASILDEFKGTGINIYKDAAILAKAQEAYREGRIHGNEEELGILAAELRATRTLVESESLRMGGGDNKDRILAILKIADGARKEVPKTLRQELDEVINFEANFEYKKVDWAKVAKAVLRGAVTGAVGGAFGGALADHISGYFHTAAHAAPSGIGEVGDAQRHAILLLQKETLQRKAEAAASAAKKVFEKAHDDILDWKFSAVVEKGEGATHVARKIAHDYLVNQRVLDPDVFSELSPEQMVYLEDTLQKTVSKAAEKGFTVGDQLELSGEDVAKAIDKALNLGPEKLQHLADVMQEPAHRLSSETVEMMANLRDVQNPDNNFYLDVLKESHNAVAKAVSKIPRRVIELPASEIATANKISESSASKILELAILLGGGIAAGGGLGLGTVKILKRIKASKSDRREPIIVQAMRKEKAESSGGAVEPEISRSPGSGRESRGGGSVVPETPRRVEPGEGPEPEMAPENFEDFRNKLWADYGVDVGKTFFIKEENISADVMKKIRDAITAAGGERARGLVILLDQGDSSFVSKSGNMRLNIDESAGALADFIRANADISRAWQKEELTARGQYHAFWDKFDEKGIKMINVSHYRELAPHFLKIESAIRGLEEQLRGWKLYLSEGGGMVRAEKSIEVNVNVSEDEIRMAVEEGLRASASAAAPETPEPPAASRVEPPRGFPFVDETGTGETAGAGGLAKEPAGMPEKPKSTEAAFNKLVAPYQRKDIIISVVGDRERAAVVSRFAEISKVIDEIGPEKLNGMAINFFKPVYGESARMSMGTRKIQGKIIVNGRRMERFVRVFNIDVDASPESIKRFIEDNLPNQPGK